MKRLRKYIKTLINKALEKRMGEIIAQIAEEAQTAVEQIRAEIEPQVATVTQVFLSGQVQQLQQLTQTNMQQFMTTLQVLNASHANHKALLRLLEPHIMPEGGLREATERLGFRYQVDYALGDLDKRISEQAHPAILQQLQEKIGKLYQEAKHSGMVEEFHAAVQEHTRDWVEGYHGTPNTPD